MFLNIKVRIFVFTYLIVWYDNLCFYCDIPSACRAWASNLECTQQVDRRVVSRRPYLERVLLSRPRDRNFGTGESYCRLFYEIFVDPHLFTTRLVLTTGEGPRLGRNTSYRCVTDTQPERQVEKVGEPRPPIKETPEPLPPLLDQILWDPSPWFQVMGLDTSSVPLVKDRHRSLEDLLQ